MFPDFLALKIVSITLLLTNMIGLVYFISPQLVKTPVENFYGGFYLHLVDQTVIARSVATKQSVI